MGTPAQARLEALSLISLLKSGESLGVIPDLAIVVELHLLDRLDLFIPEPQLSAEGKKRYSCSSTRDGTLGKGPISN